MPTITGGNGTAGVRDFYGHHFIGQWPDDTETRQVSRTVGENQVVDRRQAADGRGWFRTTDLSRVKRALSH